MSTAVWSLFRALVGMEGGRTCRSCSESIVQDDPFGMSEGVCRPCRTASA